MTEQMAAMLELAQPGFRAWNAERLIEEAAVRKAADRCPAQVLSDMDLHTLSVRNNAGKTLFETYSWQDKFGQWPQADRNAVWSALQGGQYRINRDRGTIAVTINVQPVPADWIGYELLAALSK